MTLRSLVAQHASARPDSLACLYLRDGEIEHGRLTFSQLHARAVARAQWVRGFAAVGDRVLLGYPAGLEFIQAFLGCMYAGVIPVPVELPRRGVAGAETAARLRAIAADCGAHTVLTSTAAQAYLPDIGMEWQFSDDGPTHTFASGYQLEKQGQFPERDQFPECGDAPNDVIYVQYTSGSTGEPKAVRVTGQSLAMQFAYHAGQAARRDVRMFGSWLPHFHDFGLVGFHLSALALGLPHVFMAPGAFLARPRRWLQMISRYRVTYSGAPNFAYGLCARSGGAQGLDLTGWRIASVGGETVVPETLRSFAREFAAAGFDSGAYLPAYGLAEAGLCVAARQGMKTEWFCREALSRGWAKRTEANGGVELVGYGEPVAGLSVKVDGIGEIVVHSETLGEVRTGDLGFLYEGDLYIVGRLKDVLIVRGKNLDPCDLERTAEEIDARLRPGSTAVVQVADEVMVLQEVDRLLPAHEFGRICASIARAVAARHGVTVGSVVLVRRGALPRTSSGKIRRSECRKRLARQGFAELLRWRRPEVDVRPEAREYWLRIVGFQAPRMLAAKGTARLQGVSGKVWRCAAAWDQPHVDKDVALVALFVLLHRWTGLTRLMVGLDSGGRVSPVLIDLANRDDEAGLFDAVRRQRLTAAAFADYTLEMLAGELRRTSDALSPSVLGATLYVEGEGIVDQSVEEQKIIVPLTVEVVDGRVRFACQAEVFSEADTSRLARYYIKLLRGMIAGDEVHPLDLSMLDAEEEVHLQAWSRGVAEDPLPIEELIAGFEGWAAREPDRVAVIHRGESLTYGELARRTETLAEYMGAMTGVLSARGFELVTGMVAALKAGADCVGLDPEQPALELRARLQRTGVRVLCYAKGLEQLARTICVGLECDLVCLQQTGLGQTGPKRTGSARACLEQRGERSKSKPARTWSQVAQRVRTLELTEADVVAQTAGPGSREATWQCTAALLVGARIAVIDEQDAPGLLAAWAQAEVTVAEEPAHRVRDVLETSGFAAATYIPLRKLRWIIAAGEPFAADTCRRWLACYPESRMLHGVGTEPGTGLEQVIEWPPAPADFRVPVGRPVAGTWAELRDARGNQAPVGSPGEIWLNGAATGRQGRFLEDGRIEEVGPAVTVDGWPFDTAEVEAALRRSPAVKDAAVIVVGEGAAEAVLVAFVVLRKQPMTSAGMLRALLQKTLPAAMVPSAVRFVERLPRTASGSVDRDALPVQQVNARLGIVKEPETATEKKISAIWHRELTARPIGVEDDLFELGGDSLTAARISAEIGSEFRLRMAQSEMFRAPTIRGVARYVDEQVALGCVLVKFGVDEPVLNEPGMDGPALEQALEPQLD